MIEFGKTLRSAREAKGLTPSQLAEQTHLTPSTIDDLENENFERIAAPIYGRGFVKLYCEAVGIDSKPMVEEFMAIYNGERVTTIREREVAPACEVPPAEVPPAHEAAPIEKNPDERPDEPTSLFDPLPQEPPSSQIIADESEHKDPNYIFQRPIQQPMRKLSSDSAQPSLPTTAISASRLGREIGHAIPWRLCLLGLVAIVLVSLLLLGIRMLYKATAATSTTPAVTVDATPVATPIQKKAAPVQKKTSIAQEKTAPVQKKRTPQAVPPLYFD